MTTVRPATEADVERMLDLTGHAFNIAPASRARIRESLHLEQYRVADGADGIAATMRMMPFAQYFGGKAVPCAGIAAVAVAAEARGTGLGSALMRSSLAELRARGTLISTLYPATARIYRQTGYGYGGIRTMWRVPLRALPEDRGPAMHAATDADLPDIMAAYDRLAAATGGLLQRDEAWWRERVLSTWDDAAQYRYVVREDGAVTGWVIYSLSPSKDSWRSTIGCRDLFWSTPASARALVSLAALHRSTSERIEWFGPPSEPLNDLLPEDEIELESAWRWMLRLLDVPGAIRARGYLAGVSASARIGVRDPLFPENEGPWRVDVTDGVATVDPAPDADAVADASTWASLWTGLLAPQDAVRMGALTGSADAIAALTAMFAGPTPWLADFF